MGEPKDHSFGCVNLMFKPAFQCFRNACLLCTTNQKHWWPQSSRKLKFISFQDLKLSSSKMFHNVGRSPFCKKTLVKKAYQLVFFLHLHNFSSATFVCNLFPGEWTLCCTSLHELGRSIIIPNQIYCPSSTGSFSFYSQTLTVFCLNAGEIT